MDGLLSRVDGEKFKQFLSITLALATTIVLSGFAALAPIAHGQTLKEGSLIKSAEKPEVYIINDKAHGSYVGWKRHIFNPEVFNMYGHLSWGSIQTVPQSTIDMYQTSDLYKADVDPRVYSLEEMGSSAIKHHIESVEAFLSRGYSWDQIFTVNEKEVNYYATGAALGVTTTTTTTTTTTAPAGTGLSVALASDTPTADTILSDSTANQYPQSLIQFTKVNFMAGSDGDVKVTTVKFNRTGIASDSDLGNLYLYEGDTKLAEYTSFSDKVVTFTNSGGLFTVSKGTAKAITLRGDLARGSTSVSASKTIGFDLAAASSVTTDGAVVSGTFPISGNKMTTAQVSDLGGVYFSSYTTFPATIKGDAANQELWRFNLTSDSQDVDLKRIKITMVGTIKTTDIQNLVLEVAGVKVGTPQSIGTDNAVVFDLASAPVKISSGQTKTVVLRGDMKGGSGRAFKFSVQRSADVSVYDRGYGVYVTPAKDALTTAFAIIEPETGDGTNVDSGTLTLGVSNDSPTGNVADAATSVTLAKFSFYAAGEDVKVDNLSASLTYTNADGGESSVTLANVKLLLDGSQIGTTASSLGTASSQNFTFGNTFIVPAATTRYVTVVADTTATNVETSDTLAIALATGSGNAQGQTTLTSISTTSQTARTLTIASGTASVVKNAAFGDKSSSNPTGTVNASGVKIASFLVTAGSGEAIDVTQIGLKDNATTQLGDNFQNLMIKDSSGVQIGSTIASLNTTAGTYTFTPATAIRINAGQQYVVDVFADIKSSVADSATSLVPVVAFDSVTATGVSTSASASYTTDVDLQTAYISAAGNLTITTGADTPSGQQLVMGSTDAALATFKLEADAAENINISEITISDNVSSAASGTLKNIKLYVDGSPIGQTVQFDTTNASATYVHAVFSGLSLTIPKNGSKTITVRGDVTAYDDGATRASTHTLAILANKDSTSAEAVDAKGASSGTSLTGASLDYSLSPDADLTGNQMTAYRTKLTVAYASDTPSGVVLSGSADQIVAKINVSNSSNVGNYAATVKYMNFALSQTGVSKAGGATRYMNIYKDSVTTSNLVGTTGWINLENFSNTSIANSATAVTADSANGGFEDVEIAAGSTKLFVVTLDTNDADAATDSISISMDATDLGWRDLSSASDITASDSLPLLTKTLSR